MKAYRCAVGGCVAYFLGGMAVAAGCLQNSTVTCCSVIYMGPDFTPYPCGAGVCADIPIANSDISYIQTVMSSGYKQTVVQDSPKSCKWEDRLCRDGVCIQGGTFTMTCTPSRVVAPFTPCTK